MACTVAAPLLGQSGNFSAWLEAQGVNAEVAQAMNSELGIRDYGVLRACVGDGLVRAELLAAARDRLPFGFYAVLRQVVKALRGAEPHDPGTPCWNDAAPAAASTSSPGDVMLGGLMDVLLALFSSLSRELQYVHTGEKPFRCEVCGHGFLRATELKVHHRKHTGEKPYSCQVCGQGFMLPSVLKIHLRTHTGEKPCICQVCGHRCLQPCDLKRHMQMHTGEKPYSCRVCGQCFARSNYMKNHERTRHGLERSQKDV